MRFILPILVVSGLLFLTSRVHTPAVAQESKEAEAVSLYVTVEQDGNLIQGLSKRNFRLYEDGQPVRSFRLAEPEKPAAVAVLVEHSQSSWIYQREIASAMRSFVNAAPEGHWYALATFGHDFQIQVDFTKRRGQIANAYADLHRPQWNEIDTYDAVYEMIDRMGRIGDRGILIFLGSGLDSFSSHTLEEIERLLESSNVVTYAVAAGSGFRTRNEPFMGGSARMDFLQAESFLRMLADKSGGQAWFPRFEAAFPDVLKGIMQTIENQYRIVYRPRVPADGEFHEIEVEAFAFQEGERQQFDVRVREGWRF